MIKGLRGSRLRSWHMCGDGGGRGDSTLDHSLNANGLLIGTGHLGRRRNGFGRDLHRLLG